MGHLLLPVNDPDLVERVDGRTKAAVNAEDIFLNDSRQGQVVEDFRAISPDVDAPVLPKTLVVEAVDLRDLAGLVVATDESDAVGVPDLGAEYRRGVGLVGQTCVNKGGNRKEVSHLQSEQQQERLHAVISPIHKVPKKEVVAVGTLPSDLEELDKVVELTVYVPAYGHGGVDFLNVGLVDEDLAGEEAEGLYFGLFEVLAALEAGDLLGDGGLEERGGER